LTILSNTDGFTILLIALSILKLVVVFLAIPLISRSPIIYKNMAGV
jgi:hypothetical protein